MNKFTLIVLFLLFGTFNVSAQMQNLRFGFDFSPTISWMTTNDNQIERNGLNLGMKIRTLAEFHLLESYSITSGIGMAINQGSGLQHKKGGNLLKTTLSDDQYSNLPDNVRINYHIRYIEIPIGFKMRTNEFGFFRYYFHLPIFTLGIRTRATGDIAGTNLDPTTKENFTDVTSLFNLSYGFGMGLEYSLTSSTSMIAGFAFQQGIADVTDDRGTKNTGKSENSKGTIGAIEFRVGLLF